MKFVLIVSLTMFGIGCARTQIPLECGQLEEKLSGYNRAIKVMRRSLDARGVTALRDIVISSESLEKEQERVLRQCAAPLIAQGPDCREYHLIGDVQDLRSSFRSISRIARNGENQASVRMVGAILDDAQSNLLESHTQKACMR